MTEERATVVKMKHRVLARYGAMRQIGIFSAHIKNLGFGEKCILRSERGTEWGEVVSEVKDDGPPPPLRAVGSILRRVTGEDYERRQEIEEVVQPREFTFCSGTIKERQLPMRLVSAEHIFGGEKIIFYFLADGRVDFRELVKDLATEYKTRIEMRQIGVRDEARLLAEYEHCGRELCCRTFMKDLEPVTMRMAKLQKTTLDPTKISGRCGRLMCCLRFEDEVYAELKKTLPKKGTRVRTAEGDGEVLSTETLSQTVTVDLSERRPVTVHISEIAEVLPKQDTPPDEKGTRQAQTEQKPSEGEPDRPRQKSGRRGRRRRGKGKKPQQGPAQQNAPPDPQGQKAAKEKPPAEGRDQRRPEPKAKQPGQDKAPQPDEKKQDQQPQPAPAEDAKPTPPSKPNGAGGDVIAEEWWEEPNGGGE